MGKYILQKLHNLDNSTEHKYAELEVNHKLSRNKPSKEVLLLDYESPHFGCRIFISVESRKIALKGRIMLHLFF